MSEVVQKPTLAPDDVYDVRIIKEREGKIWAITPHTPQYDSFEAVGRRIQDTDEWIAALLDLPKPDEFDPDKPITGDDTDGIMRKMESLILMCTIGLAHNARLAELRMHEAKKRPRYDPIAQNMAYYASFVEAGYPGGPLAVISMYDRDWYSEGFLGEDVVPQTRRLTMYHENMFGPDIEDTYGLHGDIDQWFPPTGQLKPPKASRPKSIEQ